MNLSAPGVELLKGIEELRLLPYDDQTGKTITTWVKGATIGHGHLIPRAAWPGYVGGITEREADYLFLSDLAPFELAVFDAVWKPLSQHQFDACVILAFNIGAPAFRSSSALKLINNPRARTPYATLEAAWKAFNKSQGRVMKGLINRRNAEWKIFTQAVYERW
jgi:GH24 family phage-related lysozyme (muramidase)